MKSEARIGRTRTAFRSASTRLLAGAAALAVLAAPAWGREAALDEAGGHGDLAASEVLLASAAGVAGVGSITSRVSRRLQALSAICSLQGKTIREKTALFIDELERIREYTVEEEESSFLLELGDRYLLNSIQYQIDGVLSDREALRKMGHAMGPQSTHSLMEHTYLAGINAADDVTIEDVAPWWLKQMLASLECLVHKTAAAV